MTDTLRHNPQMGESSLFEKQKKTPKAIDGVDGQASEICQFLVLFFNHSRYLSLPPVMGNAITSGTLKRNK